MEKYSKPTQEFISSLSDEVKKDIKKDVDESLADKGKAFRNAAKAVRNLSSPEAIAQAAIAYGATKLAQKELKPDIPALELFNFLMKEYKSEWIDWLPETIRKTILGGVENELIENKIQALATCLSTDTPWQEWHIFENVGKAFNHQVPVFGILQPLTVGECWTTMHIMEELREEDWSNEVLIYMATSAYTNNFVYLPEESYIGKAQEFLDGFGLDLDLKVKTQEAWDKIKDREDLLDREYNDSPVQVQLAKLALARQYYRENI